MVTNGETTVTCVLRRATTNGGPVRYNAYVKQQSPLAPAVDGIGSRDVWCIATNGNGPVETVDQ